VGYLWEAGIRPQTLQNLSTWGETEDWKDFWEKPLVLLEEKLELLKEFPKQLSDCCGCCCCCGGETLGGVVVVVVVTTGWETRDCKKDATWGCRGPERLIFNSNNCRSSSACSACSLSLRFFWTR